MANLIKQKFLEGIDSSKFKIEQGGAIKAVNSSGQLVEVFKFDAVNEVVKVFGDEEVAVSSYVNSLMAQEVIDRNSAINQAITDLINGAPQALDTLKELADALGNDGDAIASLINQLAQEVTDRQNGDSNLQSQVDVLDGRLDTAESDIAAEESRAMLAEQGLNTRLTQAESDIDSLEGRMSTAESDINAEESRAMLAEQGLNTRLTQAESDIDSLEGRMSTAESDIDAEESRAMLAEQGLNTRLTQAESDIDSLEGRMSTAESDIDAEESRAMLAEQGLNTRLTQAESDIDSLEGRMSTAESDIDAEESRAMLAEQGLNTRLTQAESDIDSLEGRMSTAESDIDAEESRAMLAEQALQLSITDLTAYAESIGVVVDAEITQRQTADTELQSQIDVEKGRIDAILLASDADKDSFADIVNLINTIDASNDESLAGHLVATVDAHDASAISFVNTTSGMTATSVQGALDELQSQHDDLDGYAQEVRSDLDQEILDRQAAVSAEQTRATGVEAGLQSQITQEVSDRQAAVSAEETRAMGVEASLQSQITQEVADRQADVNAEETRAMGVEAGLQSQITQEVSDRQAAVSAEETRALAAEGVLQSAIDQEISNRQSDVEILSNITTQLQDEDLTFFKHDGSRPMTGDLVMMNDVSGLGNEIKWNMNEGSEIISGQVQWGNISSSYSNVGVSKNFNVGIESPLYYSQSQSNVFDESNNLSQANYVKEGSFGVDGISFANSQDEVLDQDGNVLAPYFTRQVQLSTTLFQISNESGIARFRPSEFEMSNTTPGNSIYMTPNGSAYFNSGYFANEEQDRTVIQGSTIDTRAITLYDAEVGAPFVPTDASHAVNKAYVDSQISGNKTFEKESFEIDSVSELSYVELAHTPVENSMVVFVNRLAVHEGVDYSVSVVDGVTRLTWTGDFAVGQVEEIESGDVIRVVYMR